MENIIKEVKKDLDKLNNTIIKIKANNNYQEILYSKILDCLDELDGLEGEKK